MPGIETDNQFAIAILKSTLQSGESKDALGRAARRAFESVILPIYEKINAGTELSEAEIKTMAFLAREHSKGGMQWGGSMRHLTQEELLASKESKLGLLKAIGDNLLNMGNVRNIEELAASMKAMTDSCFCHVEYLRPGPTELRTEVSPTPEELAIRIPLSELNLDEQVAISYGIGRKQGTDVMNMPVDRERPLGVERFDKAGKVAFATADVQLKAQLVARDYDKYKQEEFNLLQSDPGGNLGKVQAKLVALEREMAYYRIPLNPGAREDLFTPPPVPTIQKLAQSEFGEQLPLVATASGTTARTLIGLQEMGAFGDPGHFDVRTAQHVGTALCGTLVHGGHHSFLEVGDIYNRLLDYHALRDGYNHSDVGYQENAYVIGEHLSIVPDSMKVEVSQRAFRERYREVESEVCGHPGDTQGWDDLPKSDPRDDKAGSGYGF